MSRQPYFEHDSRGSSNNYIPPGAMGRQRKYKDNNRGYNKGKPHLHEMDVDMSNGVHGNAGQRRYNPYGSHSKRRSGGRQQNNFFRPKVYRGRDNHEFFKILIPYGKKYGKKFIYDEIRARMTRNPFMPLNFRHEGNSAEFYVDNYSSAREMKDMNKQVSTADGFKMAVQMSRAPIKSPLMDTETTEIMKKYMSSRYDVNTRSLNLSKFHADVRLKSEGLYLPLKERTVLNTVARIIKDHIPEIETLILSDNYLSILEPLSPIASACTQLKSLDLHSNKLPSLSELKYLKGLEIVNLVVDGNPLCDIYKEKTRYISAARDQFPKLLELDGLVLPPPITFDLGVEKVPASKKSFFPADDVKDLVIQFLDQYYTIYDSGDRSKLLDAYHDHANFSLCLSKSVPSKSGNLAFYHEFNRNLIRTTDYTQRFKLLKQGKLAIVNTLSELPQSMHDPNSFSVDIFHVSPGLMSFSVAGVFKEVGVDISNANLKTFSRTYVVVAQGTGFVITNETLFIGHASHDQQTKAFKVPAPTPSPSPAPSTEEKSAQEKNLLIVELSKQTGMNLDFSSKCLEDNDWDFQKALSVFIKVQSEGKLPPEAFMIA